MSNYRRKKAVPTPPQPSWAIYLRTSSEDHQKPELSRARQRSIIDGNVLAHSDLPVIDEYIDVLTGKTPKRTGYQRLLADARVGKFSHVIVERADRFGRNDTEALRAIDELHEFGVAVRFANSPDLDPMDPDDRVLVALSFTLARVSLPCSVCVHAEDSRRSAKAVATSAMRRMDIEMSQPARTVRSVPT